MMLLLKSTHLIFILSKFPCGSHVSKMLSLKYNWDSCWACVWYPRMVLNSPTIIQQFVLNSSASAALCTNVLETLSTNRHWMNLLQYWMSLPQYWMSLSVLNESTNSAEWFYHNTEWVYNSTEWVYWMSLSVLNESTTVMNDSTTVSTEWVYHSAEWIYQSAEWIYQSAEWVYQSVKWVYRYHGVRSVRVVGLYQTNLPPQLNLFL